MWKLKGEVDTTENWAFVEDGFTKEQCSEIIKLGESLLPTTAVRLGASV